MPPKLILVRHAEGEHNATKDYHLHDPLLTATGHEQCAKLNEHLMKNEPLAKEIEVVICSPMRRTIQTMIGGLKGVLEREGVRVEMDAGWQGMFHPTENSDAPCDTGTPISTLQKEFPGYSEALSEVDPIYPSTTGPYAFTRTATLARGQSVLSSLHSRPEKVIAVVSHSGFLRTAVSASHYANADYRIFTFREHREGEEYALVEDEGTRERGGGMGWSWRGWATVEESDFPIEVEDEPREETPPPTPPECFNKSQGANGRI